MVFAAVMTPFQNETNGTVLVIGATGKVGRNVVAGLLGRGRRVRAVTRRPAGADLPADAETVAGDLSDPASIAAAATGADAVFLLWPGFSPDGAAEVVDALASTGAHVVYLSAASLQGEIGGVMPGVWQQVEKLIDGAGIRRTFLRAGGFAGNTLQWAEPTRAGRAVAIPAPLARRSLIHERDIADVAVAALLDPTSHAGQAYVLTGPASITQVEQFEAIDDAIGRRATWTEQSLDDARRELSTIMGEGAASSAVSYWASLVRLPEQVSGDVERVTGHPARSFADWARDHAGDFR